MGLAGQEVGPCWGLTVPRSGAPFQVGQVIWALGQAWDLTAHSGICPWVADPWVDQVGPWAVLWAGHTGLEECP